MTRHQIAAPPPAPEPRQERQRDLAPPNQTWIVTPCMGRLSFVQQTIGRIAAHPSARYCIVDYACPDRVGDWVERAFPREVEQGRFIVERVSNRRVFNKCEAHNIGARRAMAEGAEYLCFLDADTLVEPPFFDWIAEHKEPDRFLIAGLLPDGSDLPSMTGLLVVHVRKFEEVGGFDEGFIGWGGEDVELRLRLHLVGGLEFGDVPLDLARPLPHDDVLRSKFYDEPDIAASNRRNMARIQHKIDHEWQGRLKHTLASSSRLWFHWGRRSRNIYQPVSQAVVVRPRSAEPEPIWQPEPEPESAPNTVIIEPLVPAGRPFRRRHRSGLL